VVIVYIFLMMFMHLLGITGSLISGISIADQ